MSLTQNAGFGDQLRRWRQRRRLSQLDLAGEAEISTRHLSFVETGRSLPSRDMVLRLAERLRLPVRERNVLLTAAGYAPVFPELDLSSPELAAAHAAVQQVLDAHKPFPAFALDRGWRIASSNAALPQLFEDVEPALLETPINAMRLTLSPEGMAPRILNLSEWRSHLIERLRAQIELSADPKLTALLEEVLAYPGGAGAIDRTRPIGPMALFRIRTSLGHLSFFSTTMVFGSPHEITLSELAVEFFFPADPETAERVRKAALPPR